MTFNKRSFPVVILFLLNQLLFPNVAFELRNLEEWQNIPSDPLDCELYPDSPGCENVEVFQRTSSGCPYTVTIKSKFFTDELAILCARARPALPCALAQIKGDCLVPSMQFSDPGLLLLFMINRELQVRIHRLQQQNDLTLKSTLNIRREVHQIISDDLYWLCSRKCNGTNCEFDAELLPQRKDMGDLPSLTSLVTDYPKLRRGPPIEIYFPIGSNEISHLLRKTAPFRHLAVSSLPLTVSCQRN